MIKYGFLFSLFTTTATFAIAPLTEINSDQVEPARAQLSGNPAFAKFLEDFDRFKPDGSSPNPTAFDWTITHALQKRTDDRESNIAWRRILKRILSDSGLLISVEDYFDETSASFDSNPALVMEKVLEGAPISTLHLGGSVDGTAAEGSRQISISHKPEHAPDILTTPQNFRALDTLLSRAVQTGNHALQRIVLHADQYRPNNTIQLLLHDLNFLDWISELLSTPNEEQIGIFEIRGNIELTHELRARLALHNFCYQDETAAGVFSFLRQPEPIIDIPASFRHDDLAAAVDNTYTPVKAKYTRAGDKYTGSPKKHPQPSRREFMEAAEKRYLHSQGELPSLPGIPRGWLPNYYLRANPKILSHIIGESPSPQYSNFINDFEGWQRAYGEWRQKIHLEAQKIFLASFEPTSEFTNFKGASFGGIAPAIQDLGETAPNHSDAVGIVPDDLNWIEYLRAHPWVFVKIALAHQSKLSCRQGVQLPITPNLVATFLEHLDENMVAEDQIKLAMAVHKYFIDDIASFGTITPEHPLAPWVEDLPWGLDLHVLYMNMLVAARFPNTCGDLSKSFMLDFGFSEESMRDPYVKLQYLNWLQHQVNRYEIEGEDGIGFLPYLPGWFTKMMQDRLFPIYTAKVEESGLEGAFNFPILQEIPALNEYLRGEDWAIWDIPNTINPTDVNQLEVRSIFQVWAQLFMLDILFNDRNLEDIWTHYTAINTTPPAGLGFKALREHNDTSEFPAWYEANQPTSTHLDLGAAEDAGADETSESDRHRVVMFQLWIQAKWWEGVRTGTCLMAFEDIRGVDIVEYIEQHQNNTTRDQMTQLQRIRDSLSETGPRLDDDEIATIAYGLTESVQALIIAEQAAATNSTQAATATTTSTPSTTRDGGGGTQSRTRTINDGEVPDPKETDPLMSRAETSPRDDGNCCCAIQ